MQRFSFRVGNLLDLKFFRRLAYLGVSRWERLRSVWKRDQKHTHVLASVAQLDQVLVTNSSLNQLLNNPVSLNEYYNHLRDYFGREKFPRPAFDSICNQLREMQDLYPQFGRSLWKVPSLRDTFWIDSKADSAGRAMNKKLWRIFWRDYTIKIQEEAFSPEILSDYNHEKIVFWITQFSQQVDAYRAEIREHKIFSRKQQANLNRSFFKEAKALPELRQAIHSIIARFFALPENQQVIHFADADLLIYFLKELRQRPDRVLTAMPGLPRPAGILALIRAHLPNVTQLLENEDLFPMRKVSDSEGREREVGRTKSSEWGTMLLHPLHSLWLGIPGNDCLGGNSDSLTPARWLIGATKGTRTHVIERDGLFQGFVRSVHVKGPDGKSYGSIELWSPVFIKNLLVKDAETNDGYRSRAFFDVWFPLYASDAPKSWSGFVFSDSKLIDNFGIKNVFTMSSFAREFPFSARAEQFALIDQDLDLIVRRNENVQISKTYGEGLIFDAQIQDSGKMRLLELN